MAVVAAGVGLLAGGCGVQSTGVNVAQTVPFNAGATSSSQQASPSQGIYPVSLFLFPRTNKGPGAMVVRAVGNAPTAMDLPGLLAETSPLAQDDQYTSYVPAGITLKKTQNAHEYYLFSDVPLASSAVLQLTCTFDQYWLAHPQAGIRPTTRFHLENGEDTQWQDCQGGIVPMDSSATPTGQPAAASQNANE